MIRLPVAAAVLLAAVTPALGGDFRAIDGDTLAYGRERIRLENVDAPETHPCRCPSECELGHKATAFTQEAVDGSTVTIERRERKDQYGRTIARVYVDGRDLGQMLIEAGLARRWRGRREPWCE